MKKISLLAALLVSSAISAGNVHRYELLHTDESRLVLRGAYDTYVISAKLFCWEHEGFADGEIILSTNNLDACTSTVLISARGKTCEAWCW